MLGLTTTQTPSVYVIAGVHQDTKIFRAVSLENFEGTVRNGDLVLEEDHAELIKLANSWFNTTRGFSIACVPKKELSDYLDDKKIENSIPVLREMSQVIYNLRRQLKSSYKKGDGYSTLTPEQSEKMLETYKALRQEITRIQVKRANRKGSKANRYNANALRTVLGNIAI